MTGEANSIPPEPISVFEELMKTTMTLAANLHCSPFEIFAQDTDEVIMTINFYLLMSKKPEAKKNTAKPTIQSGKEQRIRVNDKTATGGWF